jgi:cell division septum initiation protein DivIVA
MKQIIKEVFEAEEKVGAILGQAQNQAAEIRQSAEREVSESLGRAKEQARQIIQAAIEQARKDAERICQEKLRDAESRWPTESLFSPAAHRDTANLDALVENLVDVLRTTEHETDSL